MVSRMSPMEPSMHRSHDLRLNLQPLQSVGLPQSPYQDRMRTGAESAGLCSLPSEEAFKGSWTDLEDECLRKFAEHRNATSTPCDASPCRNKCIELECPHNWCTEEHCYHGSCSSTKCLVPNYVYRRPAPHGTLVMLPLDATLCHHLTNTEKLWTEIASLVSSHCNRKRNAKQCRERWFQQLRPGLILNLPIQPEEGELIAQLVREKGQKWAEISRNARLQRRSDNAIKNWWNSSGNKKDRAANGPASARLNRSRPLSPQRVQKSTSRSPHQHSLSAGSLHQMYSYAHNNNMLSTSAASTPSLHRRSPSYQGSYGYSAPAQSAHSHYDSQHSHPEVYNGGRRSSTLSISTSQTSSNSGPNTPMTSVSVTFGASAVDTKMHYGACGTSPKDPRMSINTLCSPA